MAAFCCFKTDICARISVENGKEETGRGHERQQTRLDNKQKPKTKKTIGEIIVNNPFNEE